MAGFQLSINGRIWTSTEAVTNLAKRKREICHVLRIHFVISCLYKSPLRLDVLLFSLRPEQQKELHGPYRGDNVIHCLEVGHSAFESFALQGLHPDKMT